MSSPLATGSVRPRASSSFPLEDTAIFLRCLRFRRGCSSAEVPLGIGASNIDDCDAPTTVAVAGGTVSVALDKVDTATVTKTTGAATPAAPANLAMADQREAPEAELHRCSFSAAMRTPKFQPTFNMMAVATALPTIAVTIGRVTSGIVDASHVETNAAGFHQPSWIPASVRAAVVAVPSRSAHKYLNGRAHDVHRRSGLSRISSTASLARWASVWATSMS